MPEKHTRSSGPRPRREDLAWSRPHVTPSALKTGFLPCWRPTVARSLSHTRYALAFFGDSEHAHMRIYSDCYGWSSAAGLLTVPAAQQALTEYAQTPTRPGIAQCTEGAPVSAPRAYKRATPSARKRAHFSAHFQGSVSNLNSRLYTTITLANSTSRLRPPLCSWYTAPPHHQRTT